MLASVQRASQHRGKDPSVGTVEVDAAGGDYWKRRERMAGGFWSCARLRSGELEGRWKRNDKMKRCAWKELCEKLEGGGSQPESPYVYEDSKKEDMRALFSKK